MNPYTNFLYKAGTPEERERLRSAVSMLLASYDIKAQTRDGEEITEFLVEPFAPTGLDSIKFSTFPGKEFVKIMPSSGGFPAGEIVEIAGHEKMPQSAYVTRRRIQRGEPDYTQFNNTQFTLGGLHFLIIPSVPLMSYYNAEVLPGRWTYVKNL